MNRNGFILTILMLTVAALAGPQLYLPAVGPVALRFAAESPTQAAATLPVESTNETTPAIGSRLDMIPANPEDSPTNDLPATSSPTHEPPVPDVQPPAAGPDLVLPLIGPMLETNTIITPQMLMRFFAPMVNGGSREAIVIPQTGFTPARPPAQSSTVNFSKPKP
jgi:hypothetical protein